MKNIGVMFKQRAVVSPQLEAYVEPSTGVRVNYEQMNARIKHAVSAAVVEDLPGALITDQRTGTVCGGGGRGAAAGAGDGCACAQMKNGHTRDPLRCRGAALTARNHAKHDYSKCALRG